MRRREPRRNFFEKKEGQWPGAAIALVYSSSRGDCRPIVEQIQADSERRRLLNGPRLRGNVAIIGGQFYPRVRLLPRSICRCVDCADYFPGGGSAAKCRILAGERQRKLHVYSAKDLKMFWRPILKEIAAGELVAGDGEYAPDQDALNHSTRMVAIILTASFWACNVVIQTIRSLLEGRSDLEVLTFIRFGTALVGAAFCFLLHLVVRGLERRPFHVRVLAMALMVPAVAEAFNWTMYFAFRSYAPEMLKGSTASASVEAFSYWSWFFLAWAALYLALRYSFEVQAAERRSRAVLSQAHVAKMRALRHQINPHFMFNTLNSISALILDREVERAEAMVSRLSDFFRSSLALDPLEDVRLSEELKIQHLYLAIEQVRFPDMEISVEVPEALEDALVPPFILQPVVENSVKFSGCRNGSAPEIHITASADHDRLLLDVRDRGSGADNQPGTGTGLKNIRARLASRFAEKFSVDAGPREGGGFRVLITMPLRYEA